MNNYDLKLSLAQQRIASGERFAAYRAIASLSREACFNFRRAKQAVRNLHKVIGPVDAS